MIETGRQTNELSGSLDQSERRRKMRREPIYGLDLIRFIAAWFVLMWHAGYRFFDSSAPHIRAFVRGVPPGAHAWHAGAQFGWIGVQIFFVISGLVISYSAANITRWNFFVGRVSRLWPAAVMAVVIVLAIDILFFDMALRPLAKPALKTVVFFPVGPWLMPQFWTLPVEITFYFLVWLVAVAAPPARLLQLAVVLTTVSLCYWFIFTVFWLHADQSKWDRVLLFQHGFYFSIGIALSSTDRLFRSPLQLGLVVVGFVLAVVEIRFAMSKYGLHDLNAASWLIPYTIWASSVLAIWLSLKYRIVIAAFVRRRVALARLSRVLGLTTYPLYLVHIHVAGVVLTLAIAAGLAVVPALVVAQLAVFAVSAAIAIYAEPAVRRISAGGIAPLGSMLLSIRNKVANRRGSQRFL